MKCPVCGSESCEILKSKGKTSKELLLKCDECKTIYREIVTEKKPLNLRIVISKYETSEKRYIELHPEDILEIGDVLEVDEGEAEITSIETKRGARVRKSPVSDIETIWASSLDIPARIGVSVDFNGRVISKKVELDGDFELEVGDIVKLGGLVFKIRSIKTTTRKLRKGFAKASMIKRIYGRPLGESERYNYDLSPKMV